MKRLSAETFRQPNNRRRLERLLRQMLNAENLPRPVLLAKGRLASGCGKTQNGTPP